MRPLLLSACFLVACSSSGASSTGTSTGGGGGSSGSTSSSSTSTSSGTGHPPPPPIDLDWTDRTADAGLAGISTDCSMAQLADVDGDGAPDVIVPHQGITIYRNDGKGHFSSWATIPLQNDDAQAMSHICPMLVQDFDHDGLVDVAVALNHGDRVALFWQGPAGTFTPAFAGSLDPALGQGPNEIDAYGITAFDDTILVGRNFEHAEAHLDYTKCMVQPASQTVNCPLDITTSSSIGYRLSGRTATPVTDPVLLAMGNVLVIAPHDVDGDGKLDLIEGVDFTTQRGLRNTGSGFVDSSHAWGVDVVGHGMGITIGDLDGDGVDDLLITTIGGIFDFQGKASGGFALRKDSPLMTRVRSIWPWSVTHTDLNGDGLPDLFISNQFASPDDSDPIHWMQTIGGPADYVNAFDLAFIGLPGGSFQEARVMFSKMASGPHGYARMHSIASIDGGPPSILTTLHNGTTEAEDVVLGTPVFK